MEFSSCAEVLDTIKQAYCKLLVVNLKDNTYQPKIIADDEVAALGANLDYNLSHYVNWFCSSEFIHPDDRHKLTEFFASAKVGNEVAYRRKINGTYRQVALILQPSFDNADEVLLYVRDIENLYTTEKEAVLEKDEQTSLYNRHAFYRDCQVNEGKSVGIIYADLNGLKYANDNFGHDEGDKLIIKLANLLKLNFQDYRCYHISGDEFVVAAFGTSLQAFLSKAMTFHKSMWSAMDKPLASIGYSIGEAGIDTIEKTIKVAERSMQNDKLLFYQRFPKYQRK